MVEVDEDLLPDEFAYRAAKKRFEQRMIFIAHKKCDGNQTKMAKFMGVSRNKVQELMETYVNQKV